ncbi:hypothetical protein D3C86_1857840 [compost metagenome]
MGLLAVALMVASCGVPVCYLGPNLPPSELALAAKHTGAFAVGISLVTHPDEARLSALEALAGALEPGTRLWLGGQGVAELPAGALPRDAIILPTLLEVERHLKAGGAS